MSRQDGKPGPRRSSPNLYNRWNPALAERIFTFVRAGAFPHIAAQAAGLPLKIFRDWVQRGTSRPYSIFRHFVIKLHEAASQARLAAEIKVFQDKPEVWLRHGPGKELADSAGWSSAVKPQINQSNQTLNFLLTPELAGVFGSLFQVLSPHPEALAAVQTALAGVPMPGKLYKEPLRRVEALNVKNNETHENRVKAKENAVFGTNEMQGNGVRDEKEST